MSLHPPQFHAVLTRSLDHKAKKRKHALKIPRREDQDKAAKLNKEIKRTFRHNERQLKADISDELVNANPAEDARLFKRALEVDGLTGVVSKYVDPDVFTDFMQALHPPADLTLIVQVQLFEVDESFRSSLLFAIRTKIHKRKAPGPDLIRTDILEIIPYLFISSAIAILR